LKIALPDNQFNAGTGRGAAVRIIFCIGLLAISALLSFGFDFSRETHSGLWHVSIAAPARAQVLACKHTPAGDCNSQYQKPTIL
jgi:hypothetical protein